MAEPSTPKPIAEISHAPSGFDKFLDKNQKRMIMLGLAVAIGVATWVIMTKSREGTQRAAGEELSAAEVATDLSDIIENYPKTPAAPSAAILLSDEQWDSGDQATALETLRNEISNHPDHPATPSALARLGARQLEQGDADAAEQTFKELLDTTDSAYIAPYALASLAEIARQRGDIEKAKELLNQSKDRYPTSLMNSQIVNQSLTYIDFQMPEEVDPPEPDPAEENPATDPSEPDLSKPIELDPTNLPPSGSNPLIDGLSTPPTEETTQEPEAPSEESEPEAPSSPEEDTKTPAEGE